MEFELGLRISRTPDDNASTHLRIANDGAGHDLFLSRETQTMFILTAHLKGFRRESIEIKINEDGSQIEISGEKPDVQETVKLGRKMYKKEVEMMRKFRKVFGIPEGVNLDRIKAKFNDEEATLTILMPKLARGGIRGVGIKEMASHTTTETTLEEVPETESQQRDAIILQREPKEAAEIKDPEEEIDQCEKETGDQIINRDAEDEIMGASAAYPEGETATSQEDMEGEAADHRELERSARTSEVTRDKQLVGLKEEKTEKEISAAETVEEEVIHPSQSPKPASSAYINKEAAEEEEEIGESVAEGESQKAVKGAEEPRDEEETEQAIRKVCADEHTKNEGAGAEEIESEDGGEGSGEAEKVAPRENKVEEGDEGGVEEGNEGAKKEGPISDEATPAKHPPSIRAKLFVGSAFLLSLIAIVVSFIKAKKR
ncbi:uncharacterized protein LOC131162024 [Malania oleifera]|uniref:uncharacterized protein LOC131162024 n=1 Tax=Malania oleifera TaxID=397392 RepID=UPI0025AE7EA7|nr:uncharacterized protein LOC131162024 [Malania oleifera]